VRRALARESLAEDGVGKRGKSKRFGEALREMGLERGDRDPPVLRRVEIVASGSPAQDAPGA
jgi:hypothetical protein